MEKVYTYIVLQSHLMACFQTKAMALPFRYRWPLKGVDVGSFFVSKDMELVKVAQQ